jgi:outer membrane receptor protein involved in Fe transport
MRRHRPKAVGAVLLGSSLCLPAHSVEAAVLEEIIVTAQKRQENLQDVPVSVQVLDGERLSALNVTRFDDYLAYLPDVSVNTLGPGQSQIYMRGVSDGGDGNPSGTAPSVAIYLDEQPVTAIGRNLDVYIYDIARIETLPGPQGTLYGASSQAGTIRIITNQPAKGRFASGYDLGISEVSDGAVGYTAEGFVNVPLGERAAVRLVGWSAEEGGWIDVVPGSMTFSRSGITVQNQGNADPRKNTVENDSNDLTNTGARAALAVDLDERWTANLTLIHQEQRADGLFADQPGPNLPGKGKALRFFQDGNSDRWTQAALTVLGHMGFADVTLTSAYLDRDVESKLDYTAYAEYSDYIEPYYTCIAYDLTRCTDPRIQEFEHSKYKRWTSELRLQSDNERTRWVAGLFYTKDEHDYFIQWFIPTIPPENAIPTDRNINGRTDLWFATNQVRTTSERAAFGEFTYHFTDALSGTAGLRWFETQDDLYGFVGSRFSCYDPADGNRIGNGTPTSPDCGGGLASNNDDTTYKLNLAYRFDNDVMVYATYSEGFRPGGINRDNSAIIPQLYKPDLIQNYELGWKSTLAARTVRLNGAIYHMDWREMQLTRFDPSVGSVLGLTANTSGATVNGIEADAQWSVNDALMLSAAFSYNQAKMAHDFFRSTTDTEPVAPEGTDLPFTPDLKYTLGARYRFNAGSLNWYTQSTWSWTDSCWNDLYVGSRTKQDSYGLLNAAVGTTVGKISVELYADNLTDEYAQLYILNTSGQNSVMTNRPRTVGLRLWQRF